MQVIICTIDRVFPKEREGEKAKWQDGEEGVSLGDTVPPRPNLFTLGMERGSQRNDQ